MPSILTHIRVCATAGVLLTVLPGSPADAQQLTGKIEGVVVDQAGRPVAQARVTIIGTASGTFTSTRGYYFFNNVPAGLYTCRAQFIGLQPAEVQQVRVLGGQTITVNFDLQAPVALEAITVTVQETPIVPRDQVSSKFVVTGDMLDGLPFDAVRGLVASMPGVVESGRSEGVSIRGGRAGEAAVFVDGALVRSVLEGGSNLVVGTNALEEASVTTGAIGAEFGDAQSGVIAFNTRAGGPTFSGSLSYQTDEVFGDAMSVGFNRLEAFLSGPLAGNLTFSLAGTLQGQLSPFQGQGVEQMPVFVPGGIDTVVTEVLANGNSRDVSIPDSSSIRASATRSITSVSNARAGEPPTPGHRPRRRRPSSNSPTAAARVSRSPACTARTKTGPQTPATRSWTLLPRSAGTPLECGVAR